MSHRVTLIPGDGIGPEVTEAAKAVRGPRGRGRGGCPGPTSATIAPSLKRCMGERRTSRGKGRPAQPR